MTTVKKASILIVTFAYAFSFFFAAVYFLKPQQATAANICYTKNAPETSGCPAPGGGVEYRDEDGDPISSPFTGTNANSCYVSDPPQSGSPSVIFDRAPCAQLESQRQDALNERNKFLCESSGGQWTVRVEGSDDRARQVGRCTCPTGSTLTNNKCLNDSSANEDGGNSPQFIQNDCTPSDGASLSSENCGIVRYIVLFIQFLSVIVGIVVVGSIIYGGIQYTMSGGDPQKTAAAKDRIRNAIIALLFFIFSYTLLNYLIPGGLL